jgi:autotransporter-associated beta strand protein
LAGGFVKTRRFAAAASLLAAVVPVRCAFAQRILGLDVSAHQGNLSQSTWNSIYSTNNRQFVFIRSSRGGTTGEYHAGGGYPPGDGFFSLSQRYDDPYFVQNVTRATDAGMFAGSYHFARPDIIATTANTGGIANTGTDEATHFVQMAGVFMRPGYLLPAYDFEAGQGARTNNELAQFSIDFSNRVYTLTGIRPAIYINGNYSQVLQAATSSLRSQIAQPIGQQPSMVGPGFSSLWNARWPSSPNVQTENPKDTFAGFYGPFDDYGDFNPWDFWQYTSTGSVTGISTVDLNVSHGDMEGLKDHLVPAVWMNDSSGDWATLANWNSGQPAPTPVAPAGQLTPLPGVMPTPRPPGAAGSGPTAGSNDTVILERPAASITVTHSAGATNIRKLYMREALNITGGSFNINYDPTYAVPLDGFGNPLYPGAVRSGPLSARFTGPVTLSGGSLSVHTLQVDVGQTFTVSGGTLNFQRIDLVPSFGIPGKMMLGTNLNIAPVGGSTIQINEGSGAGNHGELNLSGGDRIFTVNDGAAAVDFSVTAAIANGAFTKDGAGTMRVTRENTYAGGTTVNGGRLLVSNFVGSGTGTGPVVMNAGTTLGGNGFLSGPVTLNAATIAPGESIGTLYTGGVTFNTGSTFNYEYDSTTREADLLNANGDLSIPANANLNLANLAAGQINKDTKLTVISYNSAWDGGTFNGYANNSVFSYSGNDWRIKYDDTPTGSSNGGAYPSALTLLALTGPEPTQIDGFLAHYAPVNWLIGGDVADATVNVSGAPGSITITGANDASGASDISYTISAAGDGTFAFDWFYFSQDSAGWDSAYYINGVETFLSTTNGQSGHVEVPVSAGDTIGWHIYSVDSVGGAGFLTINNFSAPAPEPTTVALLTPASALTLTRRRRAPSI